MSELSKSSYIGQDDIKSNGGPLDLTITEVVEEDVKNEGGHTDKLWCLVFREHEKHWIVKATNGAIIADFLGSDEMFDWKGKRIQLYIDPSVMYAGKRVGGVRARAPMNGQPAPADYLAEAKRARAKFNEQHKDKSKEAVAALWKQSLTSYFGDKPRDQILPVSWNRFVDDGFHPVENPIPVSGGIPDDDIPF